MKELKLVCLACEYPFEIKYDSDNWIDPEYCPACGESNGLEYQEETDVSYRS